MHLQLPHRAPRGSISWALDQVVVALVVVVVVVVVTVCLVVLVLVKELQSLALNVELIEEDDKDIQGVVL